MLNALMKGVNHIPGFCLARERGRPARMLSLWPPLSFAAAGAALPRGLLSLWLPEHARERGPSRPHAVPWWLDAAELQCNASVASDHLECSSTAGGNSLARERGRPARMLSLWLPLSFSAMPPATLWAGTAAARPKESHGAVPG